MANSINEALEAVDNFEFETRVGFTKEYVRGVHEALLSLPHHYQQ